jgi:hypothetical protein
MTIDAREIDSLLGELRVAIRGDHNRRQRHRRVLITALATLSVAFASVAVAGSYEDWWTGAAPAVHAGAVDEAMHENDGLIATDLSKKATVATLSDSQLVAVATKSGGFCLTAFHDEKSVGSSCSDEPTKPDGTASVYESRTSYPLDSHGNLLPSAEQFWLGYGRVTDANAASLDLSSVGLPATVHLTRGGFFLFDLPRDKWGSLDGAHGPIVIRDASGKTLRSGCINLGLAPGKAWSGGGSIGGAGDSCTELPPAPPRPDLAKAQKIIEHTLEHDQGTYRAGEAIALWQAPEADGSICSFWALAAPQPAFDSDANGLPLHVQPANPVHPTNCAKRGDETQPTAIKVGTGASWVRDHYAVTVDGSVRAGSGIAAVAVVGADGNPIAATYGAGEFFAELPDTPRVGKGVGPIPGGPYRVVGYDANGKQVASRPIPVMGG